ncbi:AraC family transcriptional regulator [Citricoccus sp. I39-566]|uniref:AraC family transcriptional regulator n=1 Tax=Citricoccus sp. I39-566 TaxID=3073268 RepID=UPI00286D31D4|nr:AraC family transcriptional regulator [Citricoccus sp. I39-566]WMY78600.1 AraC family transcriptional regulator [Citricoccus sp. I39-566]
MSSTPVSSHGPGRLLPPTLSIDTSDPDRAMSVGRDVYHPHRIRLDSRSRRFRMGLKALHLPDLTLGLLEYGHHVEVITPPLQDSYQINFTVFGSVSMGYGHQTVLTNRRRAAVHGFTEETRLEGWEHPARVVGLKIPRRTLEQELEDLTGAPPETPIRFEGDFDLETPGGQSWRSTVQALAQGLNPGSPIATHPLMAAPLTQAVARGLLLAAPHNHSHLLHMPPGPAPPDAVTDALDYLRANARQRLSVAEIALAAGVSVRTLQAGFRDHLDTTPVAMLRRIRLEGAQRDLLSGRPGTTVAAVARSWGFHHPGRFAIHFAQAFGRSPSEVLGGPS